MVKKKENMLSFMIYLSLVVYTGSILKIILSSPRPFWLNDSVERLDWFCYREYGNPSGHTMTMIPLLNYLYVEYVKDK